MLSFIPVAATPKMYNIPILFICESLKLDLKIGLKNGIEPIEWRNRIPYYSRAKRPIHSSTVVIKSNCFNSVVNIKLVSGLTKCFYHVFLYSPTFS